MYHHFRCILAVALLALSASTLCAQTLLYDVDLVMDFDNRENYHPYQESGTLFGVRLTPTVGVGFCDSVGGTHRLMAGVSYVQPFGAGWRDCRVTPTVYYQLAYQPSFRQDRGKESLESEFRLSFGFVPYDYLYNALPDYLRSDSLAFVYPNIQGALLQYRSKWGYVEAMCDWRGMMTDSTREAFRLVADGRFDYRFFYAGGYAQLNHLSHSTKVKGVCDDIVINPLVGVDFASMTPLDDLSLQAGYLFSWQRDRKANLSYLSHGMHVDFRLRWRFIGLRNQLYYGQPSMSLYPAYGSMLNQGEPYYRSSFFNRTDIYLYMIRRSFVTAYAAWDMTYIPGYGLSHRQQVVCRFSLEECLRYSHLTREERRASRRQGDLMRTLSYR